LEQDWRKIGARFSPLESAPAGWSLARDWHAGSGLLRVHYEQRVAGDARGYIARKEDRDTDDLERQNLVTEFGYDS
jgi:hypothetical protein